MAVSDPTRLAFSRNAQHLATDRQTLTTVPRYLKRHFPRLSDHVIRDLALYNGNDTFEFITDSKLIVGIVESCSIWSCMQHFTNGAAERWMKDNTATFDETDHPYAVYAPDLGWKLAIRRDRTGAVVGRALVHEDTYVRTYMSDYGRSNKADPSLEAWLEAQGVNYKAGWEKGTKLAMIEISNGYRMPYLDGNVTNVEDCGGYFEITCYGGYEAQSTYGEMSTGEICVECGSRQDEDHMAWVGRNEDQHICDSCCDSRYTYVSSPRRNGGNYFIENRYAVEVDGEYYDGDNLPDHIVELENGDYEHIDNVVVVDGDYYLEDDDDIVYTEKGDYALKDDCWQDCDGMWHSDDVESEEIAGKLYPQSECEMDDLTDIYYEPGTVMVDLPSGNRVHPSNPAVKQVELI